MVLQPRINIKVPDMKTNFMIVSSFISITLHSGVAPHGSDEGRSRLTKACAKHHFMLDELFATCSMVPNFGDLYS